MRIIEVDEPFELIMEGPFCKGGPIGQYSVNCVLRRLQIAGGETVLRLFMKEVRDVTTNEVIKDEGRLPSIPGAVRAIQLNDWATIYEHDLMANDSKVFKDEFKFTV